MNTNLPNLIDLTPVLSILATLAGSSYSTMALLQWLRDAFLDRLTQAMPDTQRNAILRGLLVVLNFAAILGLALLLRFPFTGNLVASAVLGALVSTGGAHLLYNKVKKTVLPAGTTSKASDAPPVA
jgi:hypothetical protein